MSVFLSSIRLCHVVSFFTIAFIQSKYRWYLLQARLLQKQSACMFFIQSRRIHFLFIAGPYFKISAVTTSTHLSNAACWKNILFMIFSNILDKTWIRIHFILHQYHGILSISLKRGMYYAHKASPLPVVCRCTSLRRYQKYDAWFS